MPLYEYKCRKCAHRFEKIESMSAANIKKCPKCGARAVRQFAAPAIQFKGSGWYVTDYGGKSSGTSSSEKSGDGAAAGPAKTTESKPESSEKSEKSSAKKKK
ncbi:MAG: zinc ribbon domain-containing protein [Acidobacteriia bacterium]|nr:zinc ribbon domain-containing protein [Terriglobia bacterium]